MREPQETEIAGHVYRVSMLQATRGWKLLLRVAKIVGPSIGIVVDGVGLTDVRVSTDKDAEGGEVGFLQRLADKKLGDQFFEQAIRTLSESMREKDLEHVINELASVTKLRWNRDGNLSEYMPLKGDNFEIHFQGEPALMIQWLLFALKSQFADFSTALANAVNSQGDATKTAADQ